MSHSRIQCPGCLSKLSVPQREGQDSIECPRCSEVINLGGVVIVADDEAPKPAPGESPVPRRRSSRTLRTKESVPAGVPDDDDFVDDIIDESDEEAARARKETILFLGLVGTALLVALIAFPSAVYYLLKEDDPDTPDLVDNSTPSVTAPDVSDSTSPTDAETGADLASAPSSADNTPSGNTDNADAAESEQESPAVAETTPQEQQPPPVAAEKNEPPGGESVASNPAKQDKSEELPDLNVPPAKVAQGDSTGKPDDATAGQEGENSENTAELRYRWAAGQEHIYQLKITADHGGSKENITGACTYTVKSDGQENNDLQESSGSGFIVSANGVIATCAHVVEGAKTIEVTVGEKTYPAKVLTEKGRLDLALIKIDANNLPVSVLGDSEKVQLAENVRAFGFPMSTVLGTGIKVATGAVAGVVMHPQRGKQIQTDAPINPGNSGGPIINESGQVIGIASSKIASSAASSVGFAVPVNELRTILAEQGISVPTAQQLPRIPGPELAKKVTPTVAFIKVSGTSGGKVFDVGFSATYSQSQSFNPRQMRFGGFPSFPTSSSDRGNMKVNSHGDIVEFNGQESLPYVLGPIGQFFIEPLDPYGDREWSSSYTTAVRIVKRESNDPLSRMRSRVPFGPRGRFGGMGPFGNEPEEKTLREIPALEDTSYSVGPELNGRITIRKKYSFRTTDNPDRPYLIIQGTGDIVFDTKLGMPSSYEYKATITQNDEDGTVNKLPLTVSYNLRDPEVVRQERELAQKRLEEQKKRQEEERTNPNPELVDQLLADIRKEAGGIGGLRHLQRLAGLAVVPEKRDDVLSLADNHRKNSNGFIQGAAAEIFCKWCTEDGAEKMWEIAFSDNHLLNNAKKIAINRLIELKQPDLYPQLIRLMNNSSLRHDLKKKLKAAGSEVEQPILEEFGGVESGFVKRDLVEILQSVGSEKCIPFLETLTTGKDISLKFAAQRALDAVRARQ